MPLNLWVCVGQLVKLRAGWQPAQGGLPTRRGLPARPTRLHKTFLVVNVILRQSLRALSEPRPRGSGREELRLAAQSLPRENASLQLAVAHHYNSVDDYPGDALG